MDEQLFDIIAAANELGFSQTYIRTLIRRGAIKTTRAPLTPGSLVMKHMISKSELDKFIGEVPHKSRRFDGRNKFILYARPNEYTLIQQALLAAGLTEVSELIIPANKVKFWEDL